MAYDGSYPYYQQHGHNQLPTTGDGGYGTSYTNAPNVHSMGGYSMPNAYRSDVNQNEMMSAGGHANAYDPARNQGDYMQDQQSYGQQNTTTRYQQYDAARYDQRMPHQTLQQPNPAVENIGTARAATTYQQTARGYQQQNGDYQQASNTRVSQGNWQQSHSPNVNHARNPSSGSNTTHAYQADASRARPPSTGAVQAMQQGFNRPYHPSNTASPQMTSVSTSAIQRSSAASPVPYQAQTPDTRPLSSYAPVPRTQTPQQNQRNNNTKRTSQAYHPPAPIVAAAPAPQPSHPPATPVAPTDTVIPAAAVAAPPLQPNSTTLTRKQKPRKSVLKLLHQADNSKTRQAPKPP